MFSPSLIFKVSLLLFGVAIVPALPVEAQNPKPKPTLDFSVGEKLGLPEDKNPQQKVGGLIITLINMILGLSAVLALAAIIWGGISIITSAGNEDRVKSGKKTITWAIAGLLVIGFSFFIVLFVGQALLTEEAPLSDPTK